MQKEIEAKRIHRNYCRQLDRLKIKARNGDRDAAREIIKRMTAHYNALWNLGYRITNEDENLPHIVPVTKKWIAQEKLKETKLDKLRKKLRKGDPDAARQIILEMAKNDEY